MSQIPQVASTQGSPSFDPDAFFESWANETLTPPYDNDFRKFIIKAFGLRPDDSFVYRAVAEVTLLQAQTYLGRRSLAWKESFYPYHGVQLAGLEDAAGPSWALRRGARRLARLLLPFSR